MGIMDLFKTNQPANQPAQQQQTQNQQQQNQQQQQGQNQQQQGQPGIDPNTGQPLQADSKDPSNPLEVYKDLFKMPENAEEDTPPAFQIEPTKLKEAASSLRFSQNLPQELMQKAMSGDAQAMLQAMELIGQQAYETALSHTSALTDKFVGIRSAYDQKNLGRLVKGELTTSALSSIPNFKDNPAVRAQLTTIASAFQAQNPDATPDQIREQTLKFINDLASNISPSDPNDQTKGGNTKAEEIDWTAWLANDRS